MLAAKMPLFPLNLNQINLFTVAHASRNALKIEKETTIQIPASTRKTHGQDGILILEEKRKKILLAFFKNIDSK
jgi:hypothetical protein